MKQMKVLAVTRLKKKQSLWTVAHKVTEEINPKDFRKDTSIKCRVRTKLS